jgi:hypothetical protein
MNHTKRLLAVLSSYLLAALCLTALAAATAQASGSWRIQGSEALAKEESVTWGQDGGSYAFLLPTLNLQLVFKKLVSIGGKLQSEGKGIAEFKFTEGKVYTIKGELEELPCIVGDLTFKAPTNLFLHNGKTYSTLQVETITTYAKGTGCPLAHENKVVGTIALEGNFEEESVEHLFKVAPTALFPEFKMSFGTNPLEVDGSWITSLSGAHKGQKWNGIG